MVQAVPAPPLEVIKAQFLLHLLMPLFADPARFDPMSVLSVLARPAQAGVELPK